MNEANASLDRLNALALPPEPAFWPPAPGWWIVVAVLLAVLAYSVLRAYGHWRANAYRRAALKELELAATPAEVAVILRRCALATAPRTEIAALTGPAWSQWLGSLFTEPAPAGLADAPYRTSAGPGAAEELKRYAAAWIRHHHSPGKEVG